MDITPENRGKIYTEIVNCMNKGFDGYNDDIESRIGTHQDWIDYLNNATLILHSLGKLMTADVGYDWQQNTNPYLHMDYIATMFYSNRSTCEDPEGRWFWQENFGEYEGHNNPPESPIILGLMNYYGNAHPLAWQLDWIDSQLSSGDGHPQLVGFSVWLYEYMSDSDWETWKQWITAPHPPPAPTPTPTPDANPSEISYPVAAVVIVSTVVAVVLMIRRKYGARSNDHLLGSRSRSVLSRVD